jgi:hypothetical protein
MKDQADHNLTARQASDLAISLLPHDMRIEALTKYAERNGAAALIELFAGFMGLANQVVETTREFVELYLIAECDHYPYTAEKINLPTVFGALNGIGIALKPSRGMCGGCAFRQGTPANMSPITTADAKWTINCDERFMCHEDLPADGDPKRLCVGFARVRRHGLRNACTTPPVSR